MAKAFVPDQGWSWVILVSAFLCNVTFDGIIFSFGIFYLELLDYFGQSRYMTSWIGSVISGTYAIVGPIASILANKFGCRAVTITGAIIASAGFILCTFSPSLEVMILTYGVMGGVGFGLMYLCAYLMIGHYFEKRRALATGLTSCGSGVGTFIFAPLGLTLINNFGWKGGMWMIAGIVLNGIVMGATFRPVPSMQSSDNDDDNSDAKTEKKPLMDFTLLKNPPFMVFCFSSFLCLIGFFIPFIYLPDFASKHGISESDAAYLISIIGITNTVGRVACGYVSDKPWADALQIYNAALIIGGGATICCAWLSTYALLICYACIFGLAVAAYVSLCAIILVEFLGLEKLSNSFGLLNMFRGIATFIGTPIAGMLYDSTGDYAVTFYVAGAAIAGAGVICLPLRIFRRCDNRGAIAQYDKERALTLNEEELEELKRQLDMDAYRKDKNQPRNTYDMKPDQIIRSLTSLHGKPSKAVDPAIASLASLQQKETNQVIHSLVSLGVTGSVHSLVAPSRRNRGDSETQGT